MSDGPLLSVTDLRTEIVSGRSAVTVLDNVSFNVGDRQVVALIGESGSGKTMTAISILRLVAAPVRITGGRIAYQGRDLLALSEEAMRKLRGRSIGMIFQNPRDRFDPLLTIGDQLVEMLQQHGVSNGRAAARHRAVALLQEVQIAHAERVMRMFPNELSGGMLQRAMIAVAIATSPDLLIADEPTSALDVTIQSEILDLLLDLEATRGMSILFITHDISVARQVADVVVVMYAGQVVEYGASGEVLAKPRHPYTQALLASVATSTTETLTPIPGLPVNLANPPHGCRFAPRCTSAHIHGRASEPPPFVMVEAVGVRCWLHAEMAG